MPFTFIFIGLFLIAASARGRAEDLFDLVRGDFESPSFLPWAGSILTVGSLGYIPELRTFSRMFLALLIIVLFLSNKGFFVKLRADFPQIFGEARSTQ